MHFAVKSAIRYLAACTIVLETERHVLESNSL